MVDQKPCASSSTGITGVSTLDLSWELERYLWLPKILLASLEDLLLHGEGLG